MSKELAFTCEQLTRDFKNDLKEFKDSLDHDFRKEVKETKASLTFNNKLYKEMKETLRVLFRKLSN